MYSDVKKIAERVKTLREVFNASVEEMAKVVGLTPEQYSDIEDGREEYNFSFIQKVSKHFSVDLIELVSGEAPKLKAFQIVRKGEGMPLERHHGFKFLHQAALFKDKLAEPFVVKARYTEEEQHAPVPLFTHNDQEFDYILKGQLKFVIDNYTTVLNPGDTAYYDANCPHGMIAVGGEDCEFLSVCIQKGTKGDAPLKELKTEKDWKEVRDRNAIWKKFITTSVDDEGRLQHIEFHPENNFNFGYDVVDGIAEKNPNKPAMLWVSKNKEEKLFTFKDMSEESNRAANTFRDFGIKKGDRVMLVLKRHYQFWTAMVALHKLGAIAIPATHLLTEHDFDYRFNAAGISAIVCTADGDVAKEVDKSLPASPTLKTKFIVNGTKEGWIDFNSEVEKRSTDLDRVDTQIDDIMLMYFTSGTTGYPKIAAHSSRYALGHFVTAKFWHNVDPDGLHFTISDTGWGKAVWGKLYGQWLSEAAVFTYDFDKFDAHDILPMFARYNITTFCAPPTMFRFFIKEDLSKYDLSSLKYSTTAGEALNPEVYEQWFKATGLKLMEGFGQTETTLAIANLVGQQNKVGSMGKPTPQFDIDLVDGDGNTVRTGEVGEIIVRTDKDVPYGLFHGYYRNEEETKRAWHDGMYHTGDVAWRDEDGFYWYVGRTDDVIKSSGYRIGPFEIESVLMEIPCILECAVTGVPDPIRGQVVKATIVLTKGTVATEELKKDIQNYVKQHTAPYKYPRVIEFVDSLPKTISGKIMRKDLR